MFWCQEDFDLCRRDCSETFQIGMKQSSPLSFENPTHPASSFFGFFGETNRALERSRLKFLILSSAFVESEFPFTFRIRTFVKLCVISNSIHNAL